MKDFGIDPFRMPVGAGFGLPLKGKHPGAMTKTPGSRAKNTFKQQSARPATVRPKKK